MVLVGFVTLRTLNSKSVPTAIGLDEKDRVAVTVDVLVFVQDTAETAVPVEQDTEAGKVTSVGNVKVSLSVVYSGMAEVTEIL